jgi:hypothetical protein
MERLKAIEAAMGILAQARYATAGVNSGAWHFLMRVTRHLEDQSVAAFAAEFREVQS